MDLIAPGDLLYFLAKVELRQEPRVAAVAPYDSWHSYAEAGINLGYVTRDQIYGLKRKPESCSTVPIEHVWTDEDEEELSNLCNSMLTDEDSTGSFNTESRTHTLVCADKINIQYSMLDVMRRENIEEVVISRQALEMLAEAKEMLKNTVLGGL